MNTKTVEYPVTFFDFKSWLDSRDTNDVVGEAVICGHCPVASFLREKGYQEVSIYSTKSYINSTKYENNPSWVTAFVEEIDRDKPVGRPITVKECLKVVNNFSYCTVCNQYNPEGTNCGKKDNCPW